MSEVRYSIDGDDAHNVEPDRGRESETQRTRAAFAGRAQALNELREAKLDRVAAHLKRLDAKSEAEQAAATNALEVGNWADHASRHRNIARIEAERARVEDEGRYWESQPQHHSDPVEAFIQGRDANTQAWLRAHPGDALVLATGSDPRRFSKLNAADADAFAEGHARGSKAYFGHVERFLGGKATSGGEKDGGGNRVVLTKRQAEAATDGTHVWNYGPKRGQPIGIQEFARRLKEQTEQGLLNRRD
jgi:hypothetical protein